MPFMDLRTAQQLPEFFPENQASSTEHTSEESSESEGEYQSYSQPQPLVLESESKTHQARSRKQPQEFASEATWTEYVPQKSKSELPSSRKYVDTQDRLSKGRPPPPSIALSSSGSHEPGARYSDSKGQYEHVAVECLDSQSSSDLHRQVQGI